MHCDWKRRHSRLWLANPTLWKGQARVLWMSEVLHSQYVGWLKHANILQHSEPSMISGRKNIHKHSTWWKDSLWHCEILFVNLWAVLPVFRKVRHVQIRLLQGYGNAMCLVGNFVEFWCQELVDRHFLLRCQSPSCGRCDTPPHCAMAATAFRLLVVGLDSSHFSCFCPPFVTLVC